MGRRPATHIDDPRAVGRRLKEARLRRGVSQRALSFPGCTPGYISRVEDGQRAPSLQLLRSLGERLGVSADYLATGGEAAFGDPLAEAELTLRLDETEEAASLYRSALKATTDPRTRARAIAGLGQVAFAGGEHADAIAHFEEALETWPSLEGEDVGLADSLGRAYALAAEYERAMELFERRFAAADARGDLLETLRFAVLLANTHVDRGSFGRAEELLARALGLTRELEDPLLRARLWWSQSRLHALQHRTDLAERYARMALDTLLLTDHVRYAGRAYQTLAHIKLDQGDAASALELLDQGQPLVDEGANLYELAAFNLERARALVELGRSAEAVDLARSAATEMWDVSPVDAGRALIILGDAQAQTGAAAEAIATYEQATEVLPISDRYRLEVHSKLAALLRSEGRTEEALEVLTQAVEQAASGSRAG